MRAQRLTEKHRGNLGQLVRLVEHHRLHAGEQLGKAFVAQRDIGEKQMVVHDHHVGRERLAARGVDAALVEIRAVATETVVRGRGYQRPEFGILGHFAHFADVAATRAPRPVGEFLEFRCLRAAGKPAFGGGARQPVMAKIVCPALEQCHAHRNLQGVAYLRQVAVINLVLEMARAGRDECLLARKQYRHEVGEGLAGAGAGFGDEYVRIAEHALDRCRHLALRGTRGKTGDVGGERATVTQRFSAG